MNEGYSRFTKCLLEALRSHIECLKKSPFTFFRSRRDVLCKSALFTYCMYCVKGFLLCLQNSLPHDIYEKAAFQWSLAIKCCRTEIFTVYNLFCMYFNESSDDRMVHLINQPLDYKTNRSSIVLQIKTHVLLPIPFPWKYNYLQV